MKKITLGLLLVLATAPRPSHAQGAWRWTCNMFGSTINRLFSPSKSKRRDELKNELWGFAKSSPSKFEPSVKKTDIPAMAEELLKEPPVSISRLMAYFNNYIGRGGFDPKTPFTLADIKAMRELKVYAEKKGLVNSLLTASNDREKATSPWSHEVLYKLFDDVTVKKMPMDQAKKEIDLLASWGSPSVSAFEHAIFQLHYATRELYLTKKVDYVPRDMYQRVLNWTANLNAEQRTLRLQILEKSLEKWHADNKTLLSPEELEKVLEKAVKEPALMPMTNLQNPVPGI